MVAKSTENRKMAIWSKFETCNRGIDIEHKQIPKKNIITDYKNYHGTQNIKKVSLVFA